MKEKLKQELYWKYLRKHFEDFFKIDLRKMIKCTFQQVYKNMYTDLMLQKNSLLSSHFFFLKDKKLLIYNFEGRFRTCYKY